MSSSDHEPPRVIDIKGSLSIAKYMRFGQKYDLSEGADMDYLRHLPQSPVEGSDSRAQSATCGPKARARHGGDGIYSMKARLPLQKESGGVASQKNGRTSTNITHGWKNEGFHV